MKTKKSFLKNKFVIFVLILLFGVGIGRLLTSLQMTGNVIGNGSGSLTNLLSIFFFLIGLLGVINYFKKM